MEQGGETHQRNQTNYFDCIIECIDTLNTAEIDAQITKQDVIESLRARLSVMVTKLLSGSVWGDSTFMSGWETEEAVCQDHSAG